MLANIYQQSTQSQQFSQSINQIKFSKILNDELERVFDKQKYISNTQRDYLAERFNVPANQITNWFQNKRRKLKRLERNLNMNKLKQEVAIGGLSGGAPHLSSSTSSQNLVSSTPYQQAYTSPLNNTSNNSPTINNNRQTIKNSSSSLTTIVNSPIRNGNFNNRV